MEKSKPTRHEARREQELAAMLEEALSRPGVREAMVMYRRWQEADQSMEAYRTATTRSSWSSTRDTTTDRTNPS